MARKPSEDLLSPLTLIVGQEELLLDRAVAQTVAAARADDPDSDVRDLLPGALQPGMLSELTSPSLFSERKVIVVRAAQDVGADVVKELKAYIEDPAPDVLLLLVHAGGVKGKALLEAGKKAGAREVACPKLTKPTEKLAFVRAEFRGVGRSASEDACRALLDAVGGDLRELASAASQLAADTEGTIDETVVARYYTGRAESTGFQVADLAVAGRTADALGQLRWALAVGEKPTGIVFALASGVRAIGRVATADRGLRPADLARELGMPPWKIDRVRQQMRGWTGDGVAAALRAIADADAAVKGGSGDPAYALEQCVVAVAQAARAR
ncbi:DNA polymerase III subunit delta [Streptacidiphilus anmyonensis]|uniref:DNA polymerase III subunit delta n=1 Tax=Streptacidiphilus anmyonensis TaxID=405782 RepID=UPI0005A878AD|nr:DNA polymerase III subunit delta [Streptacidiphilus anmyonensis]